MQLPYLADDQVHVAVFGPGVGELVAVRAPPGKWLLIDGCGPTTASYGKRLLNNYRARPSLIALTHPHTDHASGLREIIDDATTGPPSTWPAMGLLWPSPRATGSTNDLQRAFSSGVVEDALAALIDRWQRTPDCRWELRAGQRRQLGEATIAVRSPSSAEARAAFRAWRNNEDWNANRLATVFEVQWRGRRILLGSDLEEDDGGGWSEVERRGHVKPGHVATKVPHHGSKGALHDVWLLPDGQREPLYLVTPFASQNLPRFADGEGVHAMHRYAARIHLTGLPRSHSSQSAGSQKLQRRVLEKLGKTELDPKTPGWPDCFVIASVSASGEASLHHGPGSVIVERNRPTKQAAARTRRAKGPPKRRR